jgi:hypothetical protein
MDIITLKLYADRLLTAQCCDVYYGYSPDFLKINSIKKNIVFFAWDHHGDTFQVLAPDHQPPSVIEGIKRKVSENQDQTFWIFHSWLNFDCKLPNLKIVKYTDEVWLHGTRNLYSTVEPQFDKNFNSTKHWILLGANRRVARYIAAMYLLGTDVSANGLLKFDPTEMLEHESWESYLSYWKFNKCNKLFSIDSSFPILKNGFDKIKRGVEYEAKIYSPAAAPWVNHKNFDESLRILYRDSVVEIVNETMFMEPIGIITEKFLNSVYGYNLPIILSVPNTVDHLRSMGFDMFDDVIDHSYDTIIEPLPRMVQALSSNIVLLQDGELAKNSWQKCQHRMKNNVELAKELELGMPDLVTNLLISLNEQLVGNC